MVHAIRFAPRPHPDANRIAGLSVAIAANAALLLLLLVPMHAPPVIPEDVITPAWQLPADRKPPPPTPPVHVEVVRHQPAASPAQPVAPTRPTSAREQVTDEQGTLPALPDEGTSEANTVEPPSQPLPGVRLEYARAPAPGYPRDALRDGITGTVLLQVLVDVDGHPLDVQVARSSGNRSLDRAAREQVMKRWLFRPAMQDGRAVQAIGLVPIAFSLD